MTKKKTKKSTPEPEPEWKLPARKRLTPQEQEDRVREIYRLLITRNDDKTAIRFAAMKWGISRSQAYNYIKRAKEDLYKIRMENRAEIYAMQFNSMDDLYCQSYKQGDYKNCLQIIKEQNEIAGLHKEQIQHTVTVTDISALREHIDAAVAADPENRYKIIDVLREQRRLSGGDPDDPEDEPAE